MLDDVPCLFANKIFGGKKKTIPGNYIDHLKLTPTKTNERPQKRD